MRVMLLYIVWSCTCVREGKWAGYATEFEGISTSDSDEWATLNHYFLPYIQEHLKVEVWG